MDIRTFDIPGLKLVVPRRFADARGYFCETWSDRVFRALVSDVAFVQDNQSYSARTGTVRGLHFQKHPFAQGKLVRAVRGSIFDVAVDVRRGSPTFGRHIGVTLDASGGAQLWIPPGFLHGFCTLEADTEVLYKVTNTYSAEHDAGVLWNDPELRIEWPVAEADAVLSDKDRMLPRFSFLEESFDHQG